MRQWLIKKVYTLTIRAPARSAQRGDAEKFFVHMGHLTELKRLSDKLGSIEDTPND